MIKTKQLKLRKPDTNDIDIITEILSCPLQTKYLPHEKPYSTQQQRSYLENRIQHWQEHKFGTFIIELTHQASKKIGFIGFEYAPNPAFIDIRMGLVHACGGYGYATESAHAVLKWAFNQNIANALYGVAVQENIASQRVLTKIGMKPVQDVDLYHRPGLMNFVIESPKS
ncbi:GNAT family N-acetyltransferase [Agarivorans sp. Z349TD_8]|uniref:GNAT family N-acetyltransferase n=1 Tax=Agarivorans sp. Z349TD_8 TaxID=3421434 RepID=UPI003D7D2C2F